MVKRDTFSYNMLSRESQHRAGSLAHVPESGPEWPFRPIVFIVFGDFKLRYRDFSPNAI
jgi:hypothetical protein